MGYVGFVRKNLRGKLHGFFAVLDRPDWRPKTNRRDSFDIPGCVGEYFGRVTFIYRAIDSGMISLPDVTSGRVSLAEIAEVNHYLDMKQDIEYYANQQAIKDNRKGGRH